MKIIVILILLTHPCSIAYLCSVTILWLLLGMAEIERR